jgi:3-oxoacyl-[acyl-carrier protein] reductase
VIAGEAALPQDFAGKVAIVTGATRGIGYGIAEELIARGARVTITARKRDELHAAVGKLGGDAVALGMCGSADDGQHQADTVAQTIETFGSVDVLVNNAGINPYFGPILEADLGVFRKTMEVNVLACLAWVQHVCRVWMSEHGGTILNVSSRAALRSGSPLNLYGVSKAALVHLTSQLAAELGPAIRVNAIAPAVVKTKFARKLYESDEAGKAAAYPLKRLGVPEDTSKLAAFLLGPDSSWITGTCVAIDGGATAAAY